MQGNMGYNSNGFMGNGNGTGVANNGWSNGWNGTGVIAQTQQAPIQSQPVQQSETKIVVNGRIGAEAYILPHGTNIAYLWDRSGERLFVKTYDNNGYPCVTEDYDLTPHVDPEPAYVTKEDIREMIREALSELSIPNQDQFATKRDLEKALSRNMPNKREKVIRNDGDA